MSAMKAKDNIKLAADKTKRLAASRAEPANSDSDTSAKLPHNN